MTDLSRFCPACGQSLGPRARLNAVYCSTGCKAKAYRLRTMKKLYADKMRDASDSAEVSS